MNNFYSSWLLTACLLLPAIFASAQCTLTATSSGGNASYTQVYVLVDNSGNVVDQNTSGTFTGVSAGTYNIHALNYNPADAPSPLPAALIGQPVDDVGSTTIGCFNADFLTDYVVRVCGSCQQSNTACETDPIIATSSGANASYTQLYVLVNAATGLVEATNATGVFTGMVSAGNSYQVYALNYNPSDAPSPLPSVGQPVSNLGTVAEGCYNSDFLTDYICFNITPCGTTCFQERNVCENEDIIVSTSGENLGYTQVFVLTDDNGDFIAQNTTGIFSTASLTLGSTYHVHALNYNPSNAPTPLPSALNVGDPISGIAGGCYNADFLTDYLCYTIGCPCTGKLVQYAPNQIVAGSPDVQFTYATAYCDDGTGWRYYYDPTAPNDLLFGIEHKPTGGNSNDFTARITLGVNDYSTTTGYDEPTGGQDYTNYEANFAMGRYWNVDVVTGSLNGNVNVRFFYQPAEYSTTNSAAASWASTNEPAAIAAGFASLDQLTPFWFKTNDGTNYAPAPDVETTTINSSNIIVLSEAFVGTDAIAVHNNKNYVQFDNQISSFSGGTVAFRVTPTPVLLENGVVSFNGHKEVSHNRLWWEAENDQSTISYVLERSADGMDAFEALGTVASQQANYANYQFMDELPLSQSYYRLKIIDVDGSHSYSDLVVLERNKLDATAIQIYPNPTGGSVTIDFVSDSERSIELTIVDILGRELDKLKLQTTVGQNKHNLDLSKLPSAVYFLTIGEGTQQIVKKITKS